MKNIATLILFTLLFSNNHYYNNLFSFSNKFIEINKIELNDKVEGQLTKDYNNNFNKIKPAFFSSIIPGSGQYFYNEQKQKGIAFISLEILGWISYNYFTNKAEDYKFDYQEYSDNHWTFSNWCDHYYDYDNPNNEFRDIFSNEITGEYSSINSGHGLEFSYVGDDGIRKYMKTNTENFGDFYDNNNLDEDGLAEEFVIERNLNVFRTHDFYEEIVKYDQFFTGWDDQNLIERSTNGWGADNATSPNKSFAKNIYDKSVKNYKIQDWVMTVIYANHVISMLDALMVSSMISQKASLSYDYNPTIDFHQAEIIIKLN